MPRWNAGRAAVREPRERGRGGEGGSSARAPGPASDRRTTSDAGAWCPRTRSIGSAPGEDRGRAAACGARRGQLAGAALARGARARKTPPPTGRAPRAETRRNGGRGSGVGSGAERRVGGRDRGVGRLVRGPQPTPNPLADRANQDAFGFAASGAALGRLRGLLISTGLPRGALPGEAGPGHRFFAFPNRRGRPRPLRAQAARSSHRRSCRKSAAIAPTPPSSAGRSDLPGQRSSPPPRIRSLSLLAREGLSPPPAF